MFGPHQVPLPSSYSDIKRTVFIYRENPNPYGNVMINTEQDCLTAKELSELLYSGISRVYHTSPVKIFHRNGNEYSQTDIVYENYKLLEDVFIIHVA